jgi:hypothetical protein
MASNTVKSGNKLKNNKKQRNKKRKINIKQVNSKINCQIILKDNQTNRKIKV